MRPAAVLAAAALAALSAAPALAAERVVVPISEVVGDNGMTFFTLPVTIGGVTFDAMFDSGSTGLRVLASTLPKSGVTATTKPTSMGYSGGTLLTGTEGTADVTLGGASATVPIEIVTGVGCVPNRPDCSMASEANKPAPKVLWNPSLPAIIGVSLPPRGFATAISNPLLGFADQWIIVLPLPGSSKKGELILNPSADELAGFTLFPAGTGEQVGGGRANPIPGCIKNNGSGKQFCGPVVLDSGNPEVMVITDAFGSDNRIWTPGSKVSLSFDKPGGGTLERDFTVETSLSSSHVRLGLFPAVGQKPTRILSGQEAYYAFEVLYDASAETIGLKPR